MTDAAEYPEDVVPRGLLVDWGGVLTTDVFTSFQQFCRNEGLDQTLVRDTFRADPEGRRTLFALETGELTEPEFEDKFARLLGLREDRARGLIDRMFGGMKADIVMFDAVRAAKRQGLRTGLLSNSWGLDRYDRTHFPDLFDAVVISGEEGIRKPDRGIYELAVKRMELPAGGDRLRRRPAGEPQAGARPRHGDRAPRERAAHRVAARAHVQLPAALARSQSAPAALPRPAATARPARFSSRSTPCSAANSISSCRSSVWRAARRNSQQKSPIVTSDPSTIMIPPAATWSPPGEMFQAPLAGRVHVVERAAAEDEDVPEHPGREPHGDDVDEPRGVAEPRRLGQRAEQRHPHVHAEREEQAVLQRVHVVVAHGALVQHRAGARRRGSPPRA